MFFNIFDILKNLFCLTGSYSNDVFPEPLSPEEEDKCIKGKMNGNMDDRNKLIEHNLRLVAHIIKKFDNKYVSSDDLISIGTIGLIKGVDTFSSDKPDKSTERLSNFEAYSSNVFLIIVISWFFISIPLIEVRATDSYNGASVLLINFTSYVCLSRLYSKYVKPRSDFSP